jgi:RNA polymerase-binding transcription factor DksA
VRKSGVDPTAKETAMTQADLAAYRQRLLELAGRLGGEVSRLRDDARFGPDGDGTDSGEVSPADRTDLATRETGEEIALGVLGSEGLILAEARAALDRMDAGTFGRCEGCARPIPRERLRAVPYARDCIHCARGREASAR